MPDSSILNYPQPGRTASILVSPIQTGRSESVLGMHASVENDVSYDYWSPYLCRLIDCQAIAACL